MADTEKERSADQILKAFDALSNLYQAHRTTSPSLTRSGSSSKGSDDAGAIDATVEEARPRPRRLRRRLSPRTPFGWSKATKQDKNENYDDEEEEGEDAALVVVVKSKGVSLMLPFRSRSNNKLGKRQHNVDYDDEEEYDDDSSNSTADGERKGLTATSWGSIRGAPSHVGVRRIGCIFSLEVVAAQGLPPSLDGLRVAVTVRRKEATREGAVQTTMPARVQLGAAYFDEALYVRCHLYGTGTGKLISFEPRPFVLSLIAVSSPDLDFGRSTVDLSLFAKEFLDTCQQGDAVRQWDMVFPLAGRAKGGELVIKLAFESIDDDGTAGSYSPRKLRNRSSISNMLTPKITRPKTPKMGLSSPNSRGVDSFVLDELEPELTRVIEVKEEEQHKVSEHEPANEPTPVTEVKEEEQQKEIEPEPNDEPTPIVMVNEEDQQQEPDHEPADEATQVADANEEEQREPEHEPTPETKVKKEEQQRVSEHEPAPETEVVEEEQHADEPTPETEVKGEQQREPEHKPADEPTSKTEEEEEQYADEPTPETKVAEEEQHDDDPTLETEVKKEEQQRESEHEQVDEPTSETEVKKEEQQTKSEHEHVDEHQREPEHEPSCKPTLEIDEEEEEQQREPEHEPADKPTLVAEVNEEEQQRQTEHEPADEPTSVANMEEEQKRELELEPTHESTPLVMMKEEEQHRESEREPAPETRVKEEEQQKELEHESKDEQEDNDSELPKFDVTNEGTEGQEVKVELKEEAEAKKGFEEGEVSLVDCDELAEVANRLEEQSIEATMSSNMSDTIVDAVKPLDFEVARPEEVTGKSLQVPKQGEDRKASTQPRFKWRTVAVLVPIAVTVSKTLGANR